MPTARVLSEDSRRFFQERLALMYTVGAGLSATFALGALVRGSLVRELGGEVSTVSRSFHVVATLACIALSRLLVRLRLPGWALDALDAGGLLLVTFVLSINAGLIELRSVATFNLALGAGAPLVLRAILVPSSALRTGVLGSSAAGLALVVFLLSRHAMWPVRQLNVPEWPLALDMSSLVLWLATLLTTAVVASHVIFGLQQQVHEARQFGQYVLGEKLGEGGMGIVFLATHALLRREAALKLLLASRVDPVTLARFEREVVQTARLRHPNTVAVFDYGRTPDGHFYYVMEYLDGLTLAELVAHTGPLPPGRVVWLLAQVCASLEEAHAMGLVHRDIKPQNIMVVGHVGAFDLIKVLDFGLVKTRDRSGREAGDGRGEPASGTPEYMAPEAITAPDDVDARADLYAVAAVGYFMLVGKPVFEGAALGDVFTAHLEIEPRAPSARLGRPLAPDLEALLLRGLAKSPTDRPPSASAFRELLLACDVPRWTEQDARAWWLTHGARAVRRRRKPDELQNPPTVSVVLDRHRA